MSQDLMIIDEKDSLITFTPKMEAVIKKTIAKGATTEEFHQFIYLAKKYGLDPFKGEIAFAKWEDNYGEDKMFMTITRDGFLSLSQRHPEFLAITSEIIRAKDSFQYEMVDGNVHIHHVYGNKSRGPIWGAWAIAKRKNHPDQIVVAYIEDHNTRKGFWKSRPSAMILAKAEKLALKKQFPDLTGMYMIEEIDDAPDEIVQKIEQKDFEFSDFEFEDVEDNPSEKGVEEIFEPAPAPEFKKPKLPSLGLSLGKKKQDKPDPGQKTEIIKSSPEMPKLPKLTLKKKVAAPEVDEREPDELPAEPYKYNSAKNLKDPFIAKMFKNECGSSPEYPDFPATVYFEAAKEHFNDELIMTELIGSISELREMSKDNNDKKSQLEITRMGVEVEVNTEDLLEIDKLFVARMNNMCIYLIKKLEKTTDFNEIIDGIKDQKPGFEEWAHGFLETYMMEENGNV